MLNHRLEHVEALKPTLQEIGRVVKRDGAVFVSVPDAHAFTDRLYRKVARDRGGHVNLFGSKPELEKVLSWYFGLPHSATRTLHSGRAADRRFGTRLSVYGWGMCFGTAGEAVDAGGLVNVCLRCGDGRLLSEVRAGSSGGAYTCPGCGARNLGLPNRTA